MKSAIIALCIVGCAFAAEESAQVLRSDFTQDNNGGFQHSFESDNGINQQAQGVVKDVNGVPILEIQGQNSYPNPDGGVISTSFVANENGYQPQGAHLPTPPPAEPIPDYIQRSLEYIAAHPYVEKKQ